MTLTFLKEKTKFITKILDVVRLYITEHSNIQGKTYLKLYGFGFSSLTVFTKGLEIHILDVDLDNQCISCGIPPTISRHHFAPALLHCFEYEIRADPKCSRKPKTRKAFIFIFAIDSTLASYM